LTNRWWLFIDVPIKYEEPSDPMPQISSQSPTLKRRYSEDADRMGEKRQRVDSGPSNRGISRDGDMAVIMAEATAAATQGIEEAMGNNLEEDEQADEDEIQSEQPIFISDPHLSMRILSLPVLESLVRSSIHL